MPLPTASPLNTFGFLFIFIIAFFPNLFIYILKLPLTPFLPSTPSIPSLPPCACCPPAHCFPTATETTLAHPTSAPQLQPPPPVANTMSWFQKTIHLPPKSKGAYLVTDHIERELPELREYKVGLLNLFVQHTSCALSLNENWDEDVRADMTDALDRVAPEDRKGNLYRHSAEGLDDMPVSGGEPWPFFFLKKKNNCRLMVGGMLISGLGSYQVGARGRERDDSDLEW